MSQMIKENEFASDKNFDDITRFKDGGVKKKILRTGKGPRPTEFAECEIQYIGYFTSGKVWINTYRSYEKSVTFQMKKKKVIYGWEIACASMRKGEKARFKISSAYAYGANGLPPHIPPDTNLVFDIELVEWKSMRNRKDKFMDKTNQSYEELLAGAEKEKEAGNEFFKSGEYHEAIERYQEAVQYARFVYEPKLRHTTRPLMLACELNKAFCHLKLKNWRDCIKCCDEALKMDMHEPKAYFRKAVAHRMMGHDAEAKKNILQAKRLDSEDPGIDRELTLIDWQWDQRLKKERKIFGNLFDEETQKQLDEPPPMELVKPEIRNPIRFKEDRAKIKKTDHVTLPGEDAALDKWGGSSVGELPAGDPTRYLKKLQAEAADNQEDETEKNQGQEQEDDDMPPLETLDKKNDLREIDGADDDDDDDDMPPLEPTDEAKRKAEEVAAEERRKTEEKERKRKLLQQQKQREAEQQRKQKEADVAAAAAAAAAAKKVDDAEETYVYDNTVTNPSNPRVFFNFSVGGESAGKVIVELFADRVPKTAAIFRRLCEKGYAGTQMTRFIPDYILQGGDVGDAPFFHERMNIPLDSEGLLCVAAPGNSQFFFTLVDCSHLTGQYQVVGKVLEGIELLLDDFAAVPVTEDDVPTKPITIRSCGDFDVDL